MKSFRRVIIGTVIGVCLFSITVYASTIIHGKDVSFTNSEMTSTNVQDAVDELYGELQDSINNGSGPITMKSLYYKPVINGTGENINVNYTIPENVRVLAVFVGRFMQAGTFGLASITGEGYVETIKDIRNAQGSAVPYSYSQLLLIKVTPGKSINIKTLDYNMGVTTGNYSASLIVAY